LDKKRIGFGFPCMAAEKNNILWLSSGFDGAVRNLEEKR
jgi:hypothetical protein